jgi:hypothetical protein
MKIEPVTWPMARHAPLQHLHGNPSGLSDLRRPHEHASLTRHIGGSLTARGVAIYGRAPSSPCRRRRGLGPPSARSHLPGDVGAPPAFFVCPRRTSAGSFNVSRKPAAEGRASGPPATRCAAAAPHRSRGCFRPAARGRSAHSARASRGASAFARLRGLGIHNTLNDPSGYRQSMAVGKLGVVEWTQSADGKDGDRRGQSWRHRERRGCCERRRLDIRITTPLSRPANWPQAAVAGPGLRPLARQRLTYPLFPPLQGRELYDCAVRCSSTPHFRMEG